MLAGAFSIKFIHYTANVIVPVLVTAIVLFPFLLWIRFNDEALIPSEIKMHELSQEAQEADPVNPNIPEAQGDTREMQIQRQLQEILNPFLDKGGAAFGAVIMVATLITILAINAASQKGTDIPVFYVTLPAAFVMFCWDIGFGWVHRGKTRPVAQRARCIERAKQEENLEKQKLNAQREAVEKEGKEFDLLPIDSRSGEAATSSEATPEPFPEFKRNDDIEIAPTVSEREESPQEKTDRRAARGKELLKRDHETVSLQLLILDATWWLRETFPTVAAVLTHLPWKLIPFALCMFVLVQALVTKGWVPVFAYGWNHWVNATGVVGAIGGMGFLAVVLCNVRVSTSRAAIRRR